MSRGGKNISMNLTEEDHRRAKMVAAQTGKTLKEIFLEAIKKLEEKLAQNSK